MFLFCIHESQHLQKMIIQNCIWIKGRIYILQITVVFNMTVPYSIKNCCISCFSINQNTNIWRLEKPFLRCLNSLVCGKLLTGEIKCLDHPNSFMKVFIIPFTVLYWLQREGMRHVLNLLVAFKHDNTNINAQTWFIGRKQKIDIAYEHTQNGLSVKKLFSLVYLFPRIISRKMKLAK